MTTTNGHFTKYLQFSVAITGLLPYSYVRTTGLQESLSSLHHATWPDCRFAALQIGNAQLLYDLHSMHHLGLQDGRILSAALYHCNTLARGGVAFC